MASEVRHRAGQNRNIYTDNPTDYSNGDVTHTKSFKLLRESVWLTIFTFYAVLMLFIHVRSTNFPEPKSVSTATKGDFVEERARNWLKGLTNLGSDRFVGKPENEVKAVDYLLRELRKIEKESNHNVEIDLQTVSGSFTLRFLGEFSSQYENVNNIIVKLGSKQGSQDSLLVNCHYDSVLDSPGASDDGVSCCLMLEVLNVLSKEQNQLRHPIIFIFNGAEENILQASHGFITQHKWAKDIKAFVNLDSAGSGGRELLFQAGPGHPWMIKNYAENVPHPYGSVIGQEIFQSGLIPSDTDYRIYRDYGDIPGLDIAYIHNGYVYHTKHDKEDIIPRGCIQRGGENLLALVKGLANSERLENPGDEKEGGLVFFDILGITFVMYPANLGFIINGLTVLGVMVVVGKKVIKRESMGINRKQYIFQLLFAIVSSIISWVATLAFTLALGYGMDVIGRPMTWYTNNMALLGLYAIPSTLVLIMCHCFIASYYSDVRNKWEIEQLFFDANMCILAAILSVMTYKGISSAVIVLLFVLIPLVFRYGVTTILKLNYSEHHQLFMLLHLISLTLPCLVYKYVTYAALVMFIPVMGRIGTEIIPDMVMGGLISVTVIVSLSYQVGLVYICREVRNVVKLLSAFFLVTFLLVMFTPIGFPYRGNPQQPTKQRHIVHHIDREFHDVSGKIFKQDSGIWEIPFDHYGVKPVLEHVPSLKTAQVLECEEDYPYCGLPFYYPMAGIMRRHFLVPAPRLNVEPKTNLTVIKREQLPGRKTKIVMSLSGPDHINMYITPLKGVSLTKWSLGNGIPHTTQKPPGVDTDTYFVYYSYGTKPEKPWEFWMEVEAEKDTDTSQGLIELALGGHYFQDDQRFSKELREFVDSFPEWTYTIGWSATYTMWTL